ncbi:hypothetical protein [Marinimicrobium sp. ABcell2]|uniref:hypothetical protein n=1 Tax=Marinimicrobium sp. ABcell2 TaxID=3069751 RepID=UPI0027AE525D|nr:hypothetical protein [Marinimicrobium sp. ABcell2]MDQ2075897.1 hypothetical protein [Marinimicrobium sp. ABcell2]
MKKLILIALAITATTGAAQAHDHDIEQTEKAAIVELIQREQSSVTSLERSIREYHELTKQQIRKIQEQVRQRAEEVETFKYLTFSNPFFGR